MSLSFTRRRFVVSMLACGCASSLPGVASASGFRDAFLSIEPDMSPFLRGRASVTPWEDRVTPVAGFTEDRIGRAFAIAAGLFLAGSLAVTIRVGPSDVFGQQDEGDWRNSEDLVLLNLGRLGMILRKTSPAVRIGDFAPDGDHRSDGVGPTDRPSCPAFLSLAEIDPVVLAGTIEILQAPQQDRATYEALQATMLAWTWVMAIVRRPAPDLTEEARHALARLAVAVTSSLATPGGVPAAVLRDAAGAGRALLPIVEEARASALHVADLQARRRAREADRHRRETAMGTPYVPSPESTEGNAPATPVESRQDGDREAGGMSDPIGTTARQSSCSQAPGGALVEEKPVSCPVPTDQDIDALLHRYNDRQMRRILDDVQSGPKPRSI